MGYITHVSTFHCGIRTISKYALQSVFGPGFLKFTDSLVPHCKWLNVYFAVEVYGMFSVSVVENCCYLGNFTSC